jgi:hypothetical protein
VTRLNNMTPWEHHLSLNVRGPKWPPKEFVYFRNSSGPIMAHCSAGSTPKTTGALNGSRINYIGIAFSQRARRT